MFSPVFWQGQKDLNPRHAVLEWMWEESRERKNGGAEGFVRERKETAVLSWC